MIRKIPKSYIFIVAISMLVVAPVEAGCKWKTRGLKSYLKCDGDIAKAAGNLTKTAQEKVGKPVAKGAEHLVHEVGKVIDKTGREIGNAGRDINKYAIENQEDLIAIAVVATVAWAACVDGCTFVGSLLLDGSAAGGTAGGMVAIPLIALESGNDDEDNSNQSTYVRPSQPSSNTQSSTGEENKEDSEISYNPDLESEYPHKYSGSENPSPEGLQNSTPLVRYKSLDESLSGLFNDFSPPNSNVSIRYPDPVYDSAGGTFLSPRSTDDAAAHEAFGDNAKRIHAATDFLMPPGQTVVATLTGTIEGNPWEVRPGIKAVNIRAQDGTLSRVLYLHPGEGIRNGAKVEAGKTVIGKSADLSAVPSYKGVPNHVHVDYTDIHGRRFDPWTNQSTEMAPGSSVQKR